MDTRPRSLEAAVMVMSAIVLEPIELWTILDLGATTTRYVAAIESR